MKKRIQFIHEFQDGMTDIYRKIAGTEEQPQILYRPTFDVLEESGEKIELAFQDAIQAQFSDEQRLGYTVVGPHRDEFIFQINGLQLKNYASQGQHKTFLVALKIAEFFYLKNQCNETPILLLDDVFSELDEQRSQRLIEVASNTGQVFITSTDEHALHGWLTASQNTKKFYVKNGKIYRVEDATSIH